MTALTVEIAPGAVVGPHRHGGCVYVYLLQGRVRSQMEGEDPVEYSARQNWIEPTGGLHKHTENPSKTEPAKFLAVIYSEEMNRPKFTEDLQLHFTRAGRAVHGSSVLSRLAGCF